MGVADEVQGYEVAKQLVESMKAKEPLETLKEVLESSSKTQTNLTEEREMLMIIIIIIIIIIIRINRVKGVNINSLNTSYRRQDYQSLLHCFTQVIV